MHILIADDDPVSVMITSILLEEAGYSVLTAYDGPSALQSLKQHKPALVLLDVKMPKINGFEVCRQIRHISSVPIIFLSVCSRLEDRVMGLRLGGDDYIVKPFAAEDLLARIEAVLRRHRGTTPIPSACLSEGGITLDPLSRQVLLMNGRVIGLSPIEFRLLYYLVEHAGHVLSTSQILSKVWGDGNNGGHNLVAHYILHLRSKIEPDAKRPRYIITVRPGGYKFEA